MYYLTATEPHVPLSRPDDTGRIRRIRNSQEHPNLTDESKYEKMKNESEKMNVPTKPPPPVVFTGEHVLW